jgi:hypothetical protein
LHQLHGTTAGLVVPIGEWRWLQRIESASLIGLPVISIPTAPTSFLFNSAGLPETARQQKAALRASVGKRVT